MRDWPEDRRLLVHLLNGQLLDALKARLEAYGKWDAEHWIVNVIVLRRIIEEKEEAFLRTSATMLKGTVYRSPRQLKGTHIDIGEFDRVVPLKDSFSGYCIRTGNVVWVDDIAELTEEHPLYNEYRPLEYVSVRPESKPKAEYVFPIRVQIGLSEAILGVVNAECTKTPNQFTKWKYHQVFAQVINLLDVHGPFLVVAERVKITNDVSKRLLKAHHVALTATSLSSKEEALSNENT
jgi:hypothetical protein